MFHFLTSIMRDGTGEPDFPNVRFPVTAEDIESAERRIGNPFPEQLRKFFCQIGSGFLKAPQSDTSRTDFKYINRFLDPDEVAELFLGEDEDIFPSEGFDDGELPFFEIGDRLYLVLRDGQVCWPFGDVISQNLLAFVTELANNPRFYHEAYGLE
ncbi:MULTISPECIES: SMI1/KNR4 family protein [Pirellulaceae]|nr:MULTISPECIES: SMI1/KNR4 family protein [Pirellulaceae]